ncbi:MAG: carbamoyltransferase HypF [Candidatus Methanoperedens sp.]|nr:carbamoyltransferase HypF [Candidatus Methanoperedens sp.]
MTIQCKVSITGIVQGVGFRPFIYRVAKNNNIRGYVKNSGNSVELLLEGKETDITNFLNTIRSDHPPLSLIKDIQIDPCNENKHYDFAVLKSEKNGISDSVLPPDVAMCDTCVGEIFDTKNNRYLYPFTACTDCGPRFTMIKALPYDRENTTMSEFQMCGSCRNEYNDPMNRRFRTESVCCPDCGPVYELYKGDKKISSENPIKDAAIALDNGNLVAIKGIGGTHFCARTTDDDAIIRMRNILRRPNKPFAIMARNLNAAHNIVHFSKKEEDILLSPQRPIVLLEKKNLISSLISPGLSNTGVMLPYSGMHHLLFNYSRQPAIVMTSANIPGEPMAIENKDILSLNSDYSLLHNRSIRNRCDDSVIKLVNKKASFIRRSRGFVPSPLEVNGCESTVLSLGAELDVTACILKKGKAFLTQYIGNTLKLYTLEYLETAINNLIELTGTRNFDAIAVDLHPSFSTGRLGQELSTRFNAPLFKCQHHFAHASSLMTESGAKRMVCITADGIGYGNDGTIWGGEIIAIDDGFERAGHLMIQLMPGGDLAARYPARMAAGILAKKYQKNELSEIFSPYFENAELDIILKQIATKFNSPLTSSTGRLLDAVSALLGVCTERTYEGEPAMKLEAFAMKGKDRVYIPVIIEKRHGIYTLDTTRILDCIYQAKQNYPLPDIAASAQAAIARGLCEMAIRAAKDRNIDLIGFSGGVAYNDAIVRIAGKMAQECGIKFITHTIVPPGDGGISLGQAAMVASS